MFRKVNAALLLKECGKFVTIMTESEAAAQSSTLFLRK